MSGRRVRHGKITSKSHLPNYSAVENAVARAGLVGIVENARVNAAPNIDTCARRRALEGAKWLITSERVNAISTKKLNYG